VIGELPSLCSQANQRAVALNLGIDHAWLGAAKTAVGPNHWASFDHGNGTSIDVQPACEVGNCDINKRAHGGVH
jgi:hypothetical protein